MFRKTVMFSASECSFVVLRIISLVVGITAITDASSNFDVTTRNIIAAAGTDVRISCTVSSNESIPWETTPFDQGISQSVYDGDKFLDHFSESGRFTLDSSSRPGSYDLLIRNVELSDAGTWSCIESEKQSSDLIVTGEIACMEKDPGGRLMGENEFGIRQSIFSFQCRLNFRGNKSPVFCWFLNGEQMPGTSTSRIADNMSMIAYGELRYVAVKKLNFAILSVKAVINVDTDSDQGIFNATNVSWKSHPLEIRFAKLENHPVKECLDVDSSLMCNPPCAYKQHQRDDGSCYCHANYTLDETNYYLQVNSTCRGSGSFLVKTTVMAMMFGAFFSMAAVLFSFHKISRLQLNKPRNVDGQPNAVELPLKNNDNPTQSIGLDGTVYPELKEDECLNQSEACVSLLQNPLYNKSEYDCIHHKCGSTSSAEKASEYPSGNDEVSDLH